MIVVMSLLNTATIDINPGWLQEIMVLAIYSCNSILSPLLRAYGRNYQKFEGTTWGTDWNCTSPKEDKQMTERSTAATPYWRATACNHKENNESSFLLSAFCFLEPEKIVWDKDKAHILPVKQMNYPWELGELQTNWKCSKVADLQTWKPWARPSPQHGREAAMEGRFADKADKN